jgi:hypothetical protein
MNLRLALVAIASIVIAKPAFAESCDGRSCTATNTVQVHVGTVLRLSVQGATNVTVRSNGAWRLELSGSRAAQGGPTNGQSVSLDAAGSNDLTKLTLVAE